MANLVAKKANVTEVYCPCGSLMDRNIDWERRVYVSCTDVGCPLYGKQYELESPFEDIVLPEYVANPEPERKGEIK